MNLKVFGLFILILTLTGCQDQPAMDDGSSTALTPFSTRPAVVHATLTPAPTLEPPAVTPVPTQITHTISKGEDMGGIATRYGVKIKDLRAANPDIDPRMIPIGTVLIIPSGDPAQDANKPTSIPTPAVILQTGSPVCYPNAAGGAWCMVDVRNDSDSAVEDISVDFVISGSDKSESQSRAAFGLLNRLPGRSAFPLAVYFPSPPPPPWQVNIRLRTAFPVLNEKERYLRFAIQNPVITESPDKLSARISGSVSLEADQADANSIWVAAALYDEIGQPLGIRRWESPVGLESGSGLVYQFNVYSLDGPIGRVEVQAETRP